MSSLSLRPELPSWAVFTKVSRSRDFLGRWDEKADPPTQYPWDLQTLFGL
jgi:hypothetical protein